MLGQNLKQFVVTIQRIPSWACWFLTGIETWFYNSEVAGLCGTTEALFVQEHPPEKKARLPPNLIRSPPFAKGALRISDLRERIRRRLPRPVYIHIIFSYIILHHYHYIICHIILYYIILYHISLLRIPEASIEALGEP